MKKILLFSGLVALLFFIFLTPSQAAKPSDFGLKEGDLISAIFSSDPDVYIVNDQGYKRLFLNPDIFKFYGHLGGFFNVKLVTPEVRDSFVTSGLFRDCEDNDPKVYGVDIDGEDSGKLHWVNSSGEQAVKDDPNFFKRVFCINRKELDWYPRGSAFNTVKDVPKYERAGEGMKVVREEVTASSSFKEIGQVVICHYPPGNTSKPETLTIGASAVKAHLVHGDSLGTCPGTTPTPTPTPTPIPTTTVTPSPSASPSYSPTPPPTPSPTSTPTPTTTPVVLTPLVIDNFNSYQDGFLWNQGGWTDVVNAESFIVQSASVSEGAKAVRNNYHDGPAIITKSGASLSNGRQSLYFKTENRAGWTSNDDGNIQIRITKGQFRPPYGNYSNSPSMNSPVYHPTFFLAMTLRKDGHVTYYDPSLMSFKNFGTYNDNQWTQLETEWRSSDGMARYRVNQEEWTTWLPFYGGGVFNSFDTINLVIDNRIYYGTGAVYFDELD